MTDTKWHLSPDRFFDPEPSQRKVARALYLSIAELPLVCPHGHVDPRIFADPDYTFGSPVELLIIPDHYIFRMLYSRGISLDKLGVPRVDGGHTETDHRLVWQVFAENFYLFRGTPTGSWLTEELHSLFGIDEKLDGENAQIIYDQINGKLRSPEFRPRSLFDQFKIEALCTTDAATDTLEYHQVIQESGWNGRILPTFRPDAILNIDSSGWRDEIDKLSDVAGIDIVSYSTFIAALENRRAFFKEMGAKATDQAALTANANRLSNADASALFQRALTGASTPEDGVQFTGHMIMEMARMSIEDGLVMQLHIGSYRNHNAIIFDRFGLDKGADIPIATEFTCAMRPLLNDYGNHPDFNLILFNLDETTYARELAPLAGHYPAVKLGPPWWFHDSVNGMRRFFDQIMETAGLYNTTGFNDDTRAYLSIPARHDVWRRVSADWVAGLMLRDIVDEEDAFEMVRALGYDLARWAYNL